MIQGGGFTEDFQQKDTLLPIKNEADNGLKNKLGTIAMARTQIRIQQLLNFLLMLMIIIFLTLKIKRQEALVTVFCEVIDGLNIVLEISKTITGANGQFRDVLKILF